VLLAVGCDRVFGLGPPTAGSDAGADALVPPDAPPNLCGVVGMPCCGMPGLGTCSDGSHCLSDGTDIGRCGVFAGAFQTTIADGCAPATCQNENPYAAGCGCPSGFIQQTATIDGGCGAPTSPMHHATTITMCAPVAPPPPGDWGGWFVSADPNPSCFPGHPDFCLAPNPVTHACTCPTGLELFQMRTLVPGEAACPNEFLGGFVVACLNPVTAVATVIGAFQRPPDGSCRAYSQTLTGCACPIGAIESHLSALVDASGTFVQSTITFCLTAP
jgi:hypothetical protein